MSMAKEEQLRALNEQKSIQKKEKIENLVKTVLANYPKGFIIKEAAADSKLNGFTTRRYILDLVEEGRVKMIGKDGKNTLYILSDFLTDKQEEAAKEEVVKIEEAAKEEPQKVCAGREFENPRAITSVVAGDISWISSRSGNGLFFRYLILIVHSYKATCVNVFPEGHEAVNINDPNFIFVGEDPESGENLYADLTNVCQRRFSAFGERCMHISPGCMDNVKNRMARLLKVDIRPVGDQGTVKKLKEEGQKMADAYAELANENQKLKDEFSAYRVNRQNYIEGLHQQFKGIIHEKKETDKANDDLNARLKASIEAIDALTAENKDLKAKLADIQTTHQECVDSGVLETEDSDHMTDLYIAIATLRAQNELLEKQNEQLYSLMDKALMYNH